jgi:hypothetical protein
MNERDNTNRGAIWKNEKKEKDTHPDFTGSLNVDGVEYWVNAWRRKEDASPKSPAMSFTVRPKDAQPMSQQAPKRDPRITSGRSDMNDEIPF